MWSLFWAKLRSIKSASDSREQPPRNRIGVKGAIAEVRRTCENKREKQKHEAESRIFTFSVYYFPRDEKPEHKPGVAFFQGMGLLIYIKHNSR